MSYYLLLYTIGIFGVGIFIFSFINSQRRIKELERKLEEKEEELDKLRQLYEKEKIEKTSYQTKLEDTSKALEEQRKLLEEAKEKFSETFSALSQEALKTNNKMFMDLARITMEKMVTEIKGEFNKNQEVVESIVKPLTEELKRYEQQIRQMEQQRQHHYGSLENQLKTLLEANKILENQTNKLVSALRTPHVKGRWGEMTLKRVVELAGMSEYCDFTEQKHISGGDNTLRPDMIIHLPNNRIIVVDSKVPLQAYMDAINASDEEERKRYFIQHAKQVYEHVRNLSKKSYWEQFRQSPEFVVMFIPGESFFSAAVEVNKNLIEEGIQNRVVIATPTTLIALLRAVAYGWRQEQLTQNAIKIQQLGQQIYERLFRFTQYFSKVGKSLQEAVGAYNRAVGTLESRVLVSARRFNEMGISIKEELPEVSQIDSTTRNLSS